MMLWVSLRTMATRKGLSKRTVVLKNVLSMLIPVAAAPSVPSSSTSSAALWTTCGDTRAVPTRDGVGGGEHSPSASKRADIHPLAAGLSLCCLSVLFICPPNRLPTVRIVVTQMCKLKAKSVSDVPSVREAKNRDSFS